MPPILVTPLQKQRAYDALQDHDNIQKQGATETVPAVVDDVVIASPKAQQLIQATPPTPLFIPVQGVLNIPGTGDPDPSLPIEQLVYKQAGDNGIAAQFLAVARMINGITTDVKWVVTTRVRYGVPVADNDTIITLVDAGNLQHSTGPGVTGVPIDGSPEANYVEILYASVGGGPASVLGGPHAGERIFGRTRVGGSTSPDSVEIELVSRPLGAAPWDSVTPYAWENGQPTVVNLAYGYRQTLRDLDDTAFRRVFR